MSAWLVCADASVTRILQKRLAALGIAGVVVHPPLVRAEAATPSLPPVLAVVDSHGSARELRETCEALRSGAWGVDLPILALLHIDSARTRREALEAGCDAALAKPLESRLLELQLAHLVRRAEERHALRLTAGRLRALFGTIPHGLFMRDTDGRCVEMNPTMAAWLGMSQDMLRAGVPLALEKIAPEQARNIAAAEKEILATGQAKEIEFNVASSSAGGEVILHLVEHPICDDAGRIVGLAGFAQDVTGRKRAERDLRQSQMLLQAVFDAIPHSVFVKDRDDRYVTVNKATEALQPPEAGPVIGRQMLGEDNRPLAQREQSVATFRQVIQSGERVDYDQIVTLANRPPRAFHVVKVPLRSGDGAVTGVVGVAQDITERLQAERDLRESRALLQAVFDTIPHDLFVKDRQGRYLMVNRNMARRWNTTPEELTGTSRQPALPEREASERERTDRQVTERGELISGIFERTHPNGERRALHIVKQPLRDEQGAIVGLVGMAEDVTERVGAEEQLRQSRALLQAVFDTVPHAMFVKDRHGRYLMVNRSMARRWQRSPEEFIGKTRGPDLPQEQAEEWERTDRQVMEGGEPISGIFERTLPDGRRRSHHIVKAPLRDERGAITGLVGMSEDVTEREQAGAALQESQQLLQTIIDTLPESVYVKDAQGKYVLVNEAMVRRIGVPRERLLGQTVAVLRTVVGGVAARLREADATVLTAGEAVTLPDLQGMGAGGDVFWERHLKAPLRDAGGAVVGIVGIAEDTTERVRAEQELKASERLLHTIIDTLPVGLFVKDLAGRYRLVNAKHAALYGLARSEFLGRTAAEVHGRTRPERLEMIEAADRRVLAGEQVVESPEVAFTAASGERIWERIVKVPLRDDAGKIAGLIGVREDITSRKKAEDERLDLERLMQRTQNLESLGAMAGGIAHDFNNLLQRMLGYAELAVLEAGSGSPAQESLRTIQAAGTEAVALTRQMLTLSSRSGFALEPVDLNGLAHATVPEMEKLIGPHLTLSVRPGSDAPVVMADAPLLRQVLLSLVSNASEALAAGRSGEIAVTTGARVLERGALDDTYSDRDLADGPYGYIEVRDTGPGLPEGIRERLYEPFHSTKFMGRGLGLAAVRGIVRGHQGTIQALSAPDSGAMFRIYLPSTSRVSGRAAAPAGPA